MTKAVAEAVAVAVAEAAAAAAEAAPLNCTNSVVAWAVIAQEMGNVLTANGLIRAANQVIAGAITNGIINANPKDEYDADESWIGIIVA